MNALSVKTQYGSSGDNDKLMGTETLSHIPDEGGVEQNFAVLPPGLSGLNGLAIKLNDLQRSGMIRSWQLGRWKNRTNTLHGIRFGSGQELEAARRSITY